MAKKGRTKSSHHKQSTTRRKIAFAIGLSLIVFMVWTVLRSVSYISAVSENAKKGMEMKELKAGSKPEGANKGKGSEKAPAFGRKGRLCNAEGGGFAAFFSFCKVGSVGRGNTCAEGCVCDPFMKKGKWGVCKTEGGGGPGPGPGPGEPPVPGGGGVGAACGQQCVINEECQTGYCHPGGFELCPTAAPGQPIEDCQFIPPDPTAPDICMPAGCQTDATKCSCPVGAGETQQAAPNKFNLQLRNN